MCGIKNLIFVLIFFGFSVDCFSSSISSRHQEILTRIEKSALEKLPNIARNIIGSYSIKIDENMGDLPKNPCNTLKKKSMFKLAYIRKKQVKRKSPAIIYINGQIFNLIEKLQKSSCESNLNNWEERIVGGLLHEFAHIYDLKFPTERKERAFIKNECSFGQNVRQCRYLRREGRISGTKQFMSLAAFIDPKKSQNLYKRRSPDLYEFQSSFESFAVNFEYFLLDSEYRCRRPALYQFFASHFDIRPFDSEGNCTMSSTGYTSQGEIFNLDLNRIYQIHYLFASESPQMASRWGHSMFRIVMCRKGEVPTEKCVEDVTDDIVISFRAGILDMEFSMKKLMSGEYPSKLFFYRVEDIIKTYNHIENRDLISLPLNLSKAQINLFAKLALERYWSYRGSYGFWKNNCATESLLMLYAVLGNEKKNPWDLDDLVTIDPVLPNEIYQYLLKSKYSKTYFLKNRKKAIKSGHLFPSKHPRLIKAFQLLKKYKIVSDDNVYDYLLNTTAITRQLKVKKIQGKYVGDIELLKKTYLSMMLLEKNILFGLENKLQRTLSDYCIETKSNNDKRSFCQHEYQIDPWAQLHLQGGYGVPLEYELEGLPKKLLPEHNQSSLDEMMSVSNGIFQEYIDINQNMKKLIELVVKFSY